MLICFIGCGKTVSQNHAILTRGKCQSLKIINAFTFEPAVSLLEIYTPQNEVFTRLFFTSVEQ